MLQNNFTNSSTWNNTDFAVCKQCSGTLLLVEDVTAVLETGATYFKKEPHVLIEQPKLTTNIIETHYIFIKRSTKRH